jgi:4-amino-4-deoxy-L-arabinose transferase-like glycosyltransferase
VKNNHRVALFLILAIYSLLAMGYGLATPLFEAPDEHHHYFTAAAIAATGRLPNTGDDFSHLTRQESAQPPLYYLLSALIAAPFNVEVSGDALWPNPAVQLGAADSPQNINAFVHTPVESWPWPGLVWSAHLMRLLSTLIGIGSLLAIFASARLIWPDYPNRALLATAVVAFLPQFAFLHGSISNDPLIIFLCSAAIWQLLRMFYDSMTWSRLALLGLTAGLAILSKAGGLLLLLYSLGFVCLMAWRAQRNHSPNSRKKLKTILGPVLLVALVALGVSGWLLWRNWGLYGDATAATEFVRFAGGDRGHTIPQVLRASSGLWTSFFAVFGWFNIMAPRWVYLIWNVIIGASIVGAAIHLWRGRKTAQPDPTKNESEQNATLTTSTYLDHPSAPAALLALWVVLVYAGLVAFMLRTPAAQGRLLFPALVPLALGLTYGLSGYNWRGVYLLVPGLALLTSVYCLLFVIPGAYETPPVIAPEEIPADAQTIDVDLGEGIRLLASRNDIAQARVGDWAWVTLYWQDTGTSGDSSLQDAPMVVLELYGQDDALIGKTQSYHGGGLYPVPLWTTGEVIADQVAVELHENIALPVQARINVRLTGKELSADAGAFKVTPKAWPDPAEPLLAQINGVDLAAATIQPQTVAPGDTARVELLWQVREAPGLALTTFVHLGDPSDPPLTQGDSVPLQGHYPTTLWASGEVFSDTYELTVPPDIPPGLYPVHIGLYDSGSGLRNALHVDGTRQSNDAYLIGWLEVSQ